MNPYHYTKVDQPVLPPVLVPKNFPGEIPSSFPELPSLDEPGVSGQVTTHYDQDIALSSQGDFAAVFTMFRKGRLIWDDCPQSKSLTSGLVGKD